MPPGRRGSGRALGEHADTLNQAEGERLPAWQGLVLAGPCRTEPGVPGLLSSDNGNPSGFMCILVYISLNFGEASG